MKNLVKSFLNTESGAVTAEFVVICAAAVALGIAGVNGLMGEADEKVVNVDPDVAYSNFVDGF